MQISSTGGIFLRLDSSGNLNVYNTAGTSIAKFVSGNYSNILNKGTVVSNTPSGSTTSGSQISTGNSVQFTPQIATTALVLFMVEASNSVAGDGGRFSINRATGTFNPAGGAALDGSQITSAVIGSGVAAQSEQATIAFLDTGLTAGTAYTYEAGAAILTGGTLSWASVRLAIQVYEV